MSKGKIRWKFQKTCRSQNYFVCCRRMEKLHRKLKHASLLKTTRSSRNGLNPALKNLKSFYKNRFLMEERKRNEIPGADFSVYFHISVPIDCFGFAKMPSSWKLKRHYDACFLHCIPRCYIILDTPAEPGNALAQAMSKPISAEEKAALKSPAYREIIGCLLYLTVKTRPDIAATVSLLAQATEAPLPIHWAATRRLFRYLRGTVGLGLCYKRKGPAILHGFTDANWASDSKRRSTGGFCFHLQGGAITWSCTRQKAVSLSSTESEYYAASVATQECIWLRRLFKDFGRAEPKVSKSVQHGRVSA